MPRWIDVERVTFKYGLGDEFINVLKTLQKLDARVAPTPVEVRGVQVSPRDVVAATLPDPAELGDEMHGRTCAGTWVKGIGKDGEPREVYVYHIVDNAWSMREFGHQAVVWQTAVMPAVAIELMATGSWSGDRRRGARGAAVASRSSTCSTSTAWSGSGTTTCDRARHRTVCVTSRPARLTQTGRSAAGEFAGVGEGVVEGVGEGDARSRRCRTRCRGRPRCG